MGKLLCATAGLILPLILAPLASASEPTQIAGPIDEARLVTLTGNTRAEARDPANDRGRISDAKPLRNMILVLRRTPAREAAFERYVDSLTDRTSPNYHRWLSAKEIGAKYGPSDADIRTVRHWLAAHGFAMSRVYPSHMAIDFPAMPDKSARRFTPKFTRSMSMDKSTSPT